MIVTPTQRDFKAIRVEGFAAQSSNLKLLFKDVFRGVFRSLPNI